MHVASYLACTINNCLIMYEEKYFMSYLVLVWNSGPNLGVGYRLPSYALSLLFFE